MLQHDHKTERDLSPRMTQLCTDCEHIMYTKKRFVQHQAVMDVEELCTDGSRDTNTETTCDKKVIGFRF